MKNWSDPDTLDTHTFSFEERICMQMVRKTRIVFVVMALALTCSGCKEPVSDVTDIANALAEDFTDGIEFDNDSIVDGEPAEASVDTPFVRGVDAPNNIAPPDLAMPDSVDYNVQFDMVLDTFSTPLDDGSVQGIIAHVLQADVDEAAERYHLITPAAADFNGTQVTLRATLRPVVDFAGHSFTVRFAPLMTDGSVAPYVFWNLVVHPPAGQSTETVMCACYEEVTPNAALGYDLLDSSNMTMAQTCSDRTLNSYFTGADGYDASPCSYLMEAYYFDGPIDAFVFPSGTRFPPNGRAGIDPWSCTMQLNCD
jgi:hypothetical protein